MKIIKDKYRVNIIFNDGSAVKGDIHVSQGLRIIDFLNDERENFVAVTKVESVNTEELESFKLYSKHKQEDIVFLNKKAIKLVEEIG